MKPFYDSPPKYSAAPIDFNLDLQDQLEDLENHRNEVRVISLLGALMVCGIYQILILDYQIIRPEAPTKLMDSIANKTISFYNDSTHPK